MTAAGRAEHGDRSWRFAGSTRVYVAPDQFIGRINKMDANGLDLILGGWAALRAVNPKEIGVIAVDGKSLRGSATVGVGVGTCSPRSHIPAEWSSNNSTSMSRRTRSPCSQHFWTTSNCLECSSRQTLCIPCDTRSHRTSGYV